MRKKNTTETLFPSVNRTASLKCPVYRKVVAVEI